MLATLLNQADTQLTQFSPSTIDQYLQRRYGPLIKYLVTIIFIIQMVFYNAVVLYLPSMALQTILNLSKFYSILLIGAMCVLYSAIGGLKAVVWTDFFQAFLMYSAIIIVGAVGTYEAGGFGQVFKMAAEGGRLDLGYGFFSTDLTTRHTLMGLLFASTFKHIYLVGVNQVQMQRALSLPSLKQGQYAFIFCGIFTALINMLCTYMGFVMYSTYQSCDPFLAGEIPRRDSLIVHYVANRFARFPGLRGIFVAGIFSATLSTLSSFANSMAALALEDFIKPMLRLCGRQELSGSTNTWLAKLLATLFGFVCVMAAYLVDRANSRLLQATTTMFGAIGVPFVASFALGIFTQFTNTLGILAGFVVTLSLGTYITIYQTFFMPPLQPTRPVYYSNQCERVFNMSSPADTLPPLMDVFGEAQLEFLPHVEPPFSIERISYIQLAGIQFVLMILIASVVSLLTGGWKQVIKNEYLIGIMQHDQSFSVEKKTDAGSTGAGSVPDCAADQEVPSKDPASNRKRKFGVVNRGFASEK